MEQVINTINKCQQEKFTGKLIFKASLNNIVWQFYFFAGQVFWLNGGYHPQRFWIRNVSYYFPHIDTYIIRFRANDNFECFYYQMLYVMRQRNLISEAETKIIIQNKISDILFDIFQQSDSDHLQISMQSQSLKSLYDNGFRPYNMSFNFQKIQQNILLRYRIFRLKSIENFSLNYSPIILKSKQTKEQIFPDRYPNLKSCFNGDLSIKDIGFYHYKNIFDFAIFLASYAKQKLIKLIPIKDYPRNIATTNHQILSHNFHYQKDQPLICYIDSNKLNLMLMKIIIINAGYRFVGISNALLAIPQIMNLQPNIIFLDSMMPLIDSFELCRRIKSISQLQNIPIIMLAQENTLLDKARAHYVGASKFIRQPLIKAEILESVANHLQAKFSFC